jgi:hypothetical protein
VVVSSFIFLYLFFPECDKRIQAVIQSATRAQRELEPLFAYLRHKENPEKYKKIGKKEKSV